ncbi:MAG TPA: hypothetical protein VGA73_02650 [Candidatus Binatia bacterium]
MKKANLKKTLLGFAFISLLFTSLAGCVVYDEPYPRYSSRGYYYHPYYYGGYYGPRYSYRYRDRWE